ncbi:MAG: hypothetical protein ABSA96_18660, partial [Candidatus Acidiferrales bacterium]
MKKEIAITISTALLTGQILSTGEGLHIHAELRAQNTTSDHTNSTSGSLFYRYWVSGVAPSKCFATRREVIREANSRGHSDPIIEVVNQDGMSPSQTFMDCPYPEL